MAETFYEHPIVNSPCEYPRRHWELDGDGQPTNRLLDCRRRSDLITPVTKAKKRKAPKGPVAQAELDLASDDEGLSTAELIERLREDQEDIVRTRAVEGSVNLAAFGALLRRQLGAS